MEPAALAWPGPSVALGFSPRRGGWEGAGRGQAGWGKAWGRRWGPAGRPARPPCPARRRSPPVDGLAPGPAAPSAPGAAAAALGRADAAGGVRGLCGAGRRRSAGAGAAGRGAGSPTPPPAALGAARQPHLPAGARPPAAHRGEPVGPFAGAAAAEQSTPSWELPR